MPPGPALRPDRVVLHDRTVVAVEGPEARDFLQRLLTSDIDTLAAGDARYAALLSPQGKIVTDMIAIGTADGVLLDVPAATAPDLVKKLTLYRLRAKVTIVDRSGALAVEAHTGAAPANAVAAVGDPRDASLWQRAIVPRDTAEPRDPAAAALIAYHATRIAAGVPDGGRDFAYGETFPHEANLDHLHGVDFTKGCYVGQEVVSRVQHRGTARKRIVAVSFDGDAPAPGTEIAAGDVAIGTMGSAIAGHGLATIRLDRLAEATGPVTAAGTLLRVSLPVWAS